MFESDDGLPTYKIQRKKPKKGVWTPWEPIEVLSPVRVPQLEQGANNLSRPVLEGGLVVDSGRTPASAQPDIFGLSIEPATPPRRSSSESPSEPPAPPGQSPRPLGAEATGPPVAGESRRSPLHNGFNDSWLQSGFAGSRNRLQQQFLFVVLRVQERNPGISLGGALAKVIETLIATGSFENEHQIESAWTFAFQEPLRELFARFFTLSAAAIQRLMLQAWQGFK